MIDKKSDIIDVIIKDTLLVFSDQLIDLLGAKVGDRIAIGYIDYQGNLTPIISLNDNGNKLSGNNSIVFKGKRQEVLSQFGSNFWAQKDNGNIILKGDGVPIYTSVKKASDTFLTKEIIEDTNYNITKLTNYEF